LSTSVSDQTTNHVPEPVAPIAEVMSAFRAPWALCGGWAVDAWLGRQTRDHGDLDISVFIQDQRALFDHLAGWQLIAHDPHVPGNTSEPWDGRRLDLPGHIHGRLEAGEGLPDRLDAPSQQGFSLDIQLDERSGGDWILSHEPRITLPLRQSIQQSAWGLPTVVPEALLFYKARGLRRRDKLDFLALLPHLTDEQRDWLRMAIALAGHPWVTQLSR
jgi:hypothetical protein